MKPMLASHARVKKDFLLSEKLPYPDERVCYRIFLCTVVFVLCILALLYLTNQNPNVVETAETAFHGLGTVFVKGSMGMDDLVVAHVAKNMSTQELKLFLRTFYRSGLAAKADMVLIFNSDVLPAAMENTVHKEATHLCRLLSQEKHSLAHTSDEKRSIFAAFNHTMYMKHIPYKASIWGHHPHESSQCNKNTMLDDSSMKIAVGSVVGFSVSELNAENGFEDFIDRPSLELRRWACYQLLLGMVKHEYKHVLLTGVSGVVIMDDPFITVRTKLGLYLSFADATWGSLSKLSGKDGDGELGLFEEMKQFNHSIIRGSNGAGQGHLHDAMALAMHPTVISNGGKIFKERHIQKRVRRLRKRRKTRSHGGVGDGGIYEQVYGRMMLGVLDDEEKNKRVINSDAIVGGIQHVLALADAMVVEIVRVAMPRRSRAAFPDNVLLSHLVHMHKSSIGVLGKKVAEGELQVFENSESFLHSLAGSQQPSLFFQGQSRCPYAMISEGHHNGKTSLWSYVVGMVHHHICLSSLGAKIYDDCEH